MWRATAMDDGGRKSASSSSAKAFATSARLTHIASAISAVSSVSATTGNYFFREHQANDHEDFGQMLLTTGSGVVASIMAGRAGWLSHPHRGLDTVWLIGTDGVAMVDAHRPRFNVFADEPAWASPPYNAADPMGFWSSTATYAPKSAWTPLVAMGSDVSYFLDCLEKGQASDVPCEIAAAATEVLLGAYRSAAMGESVSLPLARKS